MRVYFSDSVFGYTHIPERENATIICFVWAKSHRDELESAACLSLRMQTSRLKTWKHETSAEIQIRDEISSRSDLLSCVLGTENQSNVNKILYKLL